LPLYLYDVRTDQDLFVQFEMIDAALKHDPSITKGKEGVYQFTLQGEDGGTYQIIIDEKGGRAVSGEELKPTCILVINTEDFKDMIAKKLNPTVAFMSGKLKIKGNMGLALKLQTLLNAVNF